MVARRVSSSWRRKPRLEVMAQSMQDFVTLIWVSVVLGMAVKRSRSSLTISLLVSFHASHFTYEYRIT